MKPPVSTRFERRLARHRDDRAEARQRFRLRWRQVKEDLSAESIINRTKARIEETAFEAADHAIEVAQEHKGVVAATAGTLVLWFLRKPLIAGAVALFTSHEVHNGDANLDREDI